MKKLVTMLFATVLCAQAWALPNPASVNCIEHGGKFALIQQYGFCFFNDTSYCEEWAFMKENCVTGQNHFVGGKIDLNHLSKYCVVADEKNPTIELCKE